MKISVLMSVFNKDSPLFLEEALKSLVDQTLHPDEVVLVEDGPLNKELEMVIDSFRSQINILSVKLEKNSGLAVALNEGLKHCSHDLIARMDSDDVCLPERLSRQAAYFVEHKNIDVIGSYVWEINEFGERGALRKMPADHDSIVSLLWSNPLIHPSVVFKKESLLRVGCYDSALRRRQDYDLWFRGAKAGWRFANIKEPLLLYRFTISTYKKQSIRRALEQGLIGFRGTCLLKMPLWKRAACFFPFLRSFFPASIQHCIYCCLRKLDPRQKSS